uniref:Uncharacterized protein n=1 Tax=Arundo donax TaxID=35708 RepID=A0A0A9GCF9_ARUDO
MYGQTFPFSRAGWLSSCPLAIDFLIVLGGSSSPRYLKRRFTRPVCNSESTGI